LADLYIAIRRERWFPRVMEISGEFEGGRHLQTAAEQLWSASVTARNESDLYRSDAMSQEAARTQHMSSRRIQAWNDETQKAPSRKTRHVWAASRDALLLQGAGLLIELMAWERLLTFRDAGAQADLGQLHGQGAEHCAFGAVVVAAIREREKETEVLQLAAEANQRNETLMQAREHLLRKYPVEASRWHAWVETRAPGS
jgi:hypothetical protein